MALPAREGAPLEVIEAEFILKLLILLLDGPALMRELHERAQGRLQLIPLNRGRLTECIASARVTCRALQNAMRRTSRLSPWPCAIDRTRPVGLSLSASSRQSLRGAPAFDSARFGARAAS